MEGVDVLLIIGGLIAGCLWLCGLGGRAGDKGQQSGPM